MKNPYITVEIIRISGKRETKQIPKDVVWKEIDAIIGAQFLDHVNLRDGRMMWVDDLGHDKQLPTNAIATELYWSVCRPGTLHRIVGDVVITNEADFEDEE